MYIVAPVLFLAALWLDHKGVVSFGKWVLGLVQKNPLVGIGAILIGVIAYPVVALFLFGKALVKRKVKQVTQQFEERTSGGMGNRNTGTEEFTEYEEVDFEDLEVKEPKLELPPLQKRQKNTSKNNEYDSFFE